MFVDQIRTKLRLKLNWKLANLRQKARMPKLRPLVWWGWEWGGGRVGEGREGRREGRWGKADTDDDTDRN